MMRRLTSALLALAVAAVLVVAGIEQPGAQPQQAQAATPMFAIEAAHPGFTPALDGSEPVFFLVLGDNYRKGIEESHLTDSIHVIGINPEKHRGTIVGLPRDSWVPIPGHGTAKINEAYHDGGCKLAVATVEQLSGITLDYCVVTGFIGFKALVTEVGGVQVNVPYPIDDTHSKAKFNKGKEVMTGKEALSFVRARYDVPNGDFSRSENQGLFLLSMLAQEQKQTKKDPSLMLRYLASTMRNVDTGDLSSDELINLAFTAEAIPMKAVNNEVCLGSIDMVGAQSVVKLGSQCTKLFKKMKNDGIA